MPVLPRYKAPRVTPQTGGGVAQRAQAQMLGSLAERIGSFKAPILQKMAQTAEVKAKKDAQKAFTTSGLDAEITDEMTVYGQTYNNALQNMHKKQLSIDTGVTMENAYNANKDNPVAFEETTKATYKETSNLLPEHLKADYAIDFEANKARYFGQVKKNRVQLDKEKDLALTNKLYTQASQNSSIASRDGNYELALYETNKGIDALQSSLDAGTIKAEKYRKGVADIKFASSSSMFKGINDKHIQEGDIEGSQKYIEDFRTSAPEGFSDKQRESLADDMQSDLNSKIKQDTIAGKAQKAQFTAVVTDAKKIFKAGKKPENLDEVYMAAASVSASQVYELQVAEQAYNIVQKVGDKTLPEQRAIINAIEADPEATRVDIEALSLAKKDLSEKMRLAEKDPYSLGVQDGLFEQTAPITPYEGIENLSIRAEQSDMTVAAYGTSPKLLTDAEAQGFSAWLERPTTSISDKLDFIAQVEATAPNKSNAVYDQLMKKGSSVFAFAGSMVKKGDIQKAEKMLRGQMILREQPNVVPMDIMQWKFNGEVGNAMRYQGSGMRKALIDGTTAYYAALAEEQGELSKADAPISLVKQAVQEVTGGVGIKNDQNYFLPPQATEDDVDDWLDDLTSKDFENVGGISSEDAVDLVSRGQLVSVGPGSYQVIFQGNRLMAKDGKPLIMKYFK